MIVVFLLVNGSENSPTLSSCLGNYAYYDRVGIAPYINQNQDRKFASHLCSSESLVARVFCYFAYASFFLFANNITEAFLLYRCFKKIQEQTKSAKSIMGENSYMKRKQ